jgi:hypothetical protein
MLHRFAGLLAGIQIIGNVCESTPAGAAEFDNKHCRNRSRMLGTSVAKENFL